MPDMSDDAPLTRGEFRAELQVTRGEFRAEFAAFQMRLFSHLHELRTEINGRFDDVDARFREVHGQFDGFAVKFDRLETEYAMIREGLGRLEGEVHGTSGDQG